MSTATTAISPKDKFLENFQELTFTNESNYTQKIRKEALSALKALEFPTTRHEDWKYTKITSILKSNYKIIRPSANINIEKYRIKGLDASIMVFVNGFFIKDLSETSSSADKIIIENMETAKTKYADIFNNYFCKYADHKNQPFTALNTAFSVDGAFIYIADKAVIERPIHIIYLTDGDAVATQPRNLFIAGKSSAAKIIITYETISGNNTFNNPVTEIIVKENAHLELDKLQYENSGTSHISTEQVYQETYSNFTINTITLNGGLVRNNLNIIVDAENCESNLYGLYLLNDKQHVDNHTLVDHKKPHCVSNELYKGIMNDQSTGVFNGKVFVRPDAQKTNAFQSNKNILLTDDATINSKPELEIYADDVKCSHGSTTGQLDDEAIFYLRSRGITKENAINLLMYAFASDVLENIKITSLKIKIEKILAERFNNTE